MRKLISLLVVLGMLFVAGPVLAGGGADGAAYQSNGDWAGLSFTGTYAYGSNATRGQFGGTYNGWGGVIGFANADGRTNAFANPGLLNASAGAYTYGESDATMLGGGFAYGNLQTGVMGQGSVYHETSPLIGSGTGTVGSAGFSYGDVDSTGWCGIGVEHTQGAGFAATYGTSHQGWGNASASTVSVAGSFAN